MSESKIDIDRLIAAAQEIERIKNASREQSAELARLAKKARAGTLTAEDREYSYSMQRAVTANSLDSAVDELVGALHSKPATWK